VFEELLMRAPKALLESVAKMALIAAVVGGVACGCSGRSVGGEGCDPKCSEPYVCDNDTGECVCPEGECCAMVDCWCYEGETHCFGGSLFGCELRLIEEDGMCGSVCDYPLLYQCEQGCVDVDYRYAVCLEEDEGCRQTPDEELLVTADVAGDDIYDCSKPQLDEPVVLEVSGTVGQTWRDDSFVVVPGVAQPEVSLTHSLPWYVHNCIWSGREVFVRLAWRIDPAQPTYCIRSVEVRGETADGELLLYAQDGTAEVDADLPFSVSLQELDCAVLEQEPCQPPATFAMALAFDSGPVATVRQTETTEVDVSGKIYEVHNMRSYRLGACDDHWSYGFYVTQLCGDR
jgi:hypothetical protein